MVDSIRMETLVSQSSGTDLSPGFGTGRHPFEGKQEGFKQVYDGDGFFGKDCAVLSRLLWRHDRD